MNRQSSETAGAFKAGGVVKVVSGGAFFGSRLFCEERMMVHEGRDDFEVVGHVGPHMQEAVRLKDASDSVGKKIGEEAAAAMLALPPRVGKVNVNSRQRRCTNSFIEKVIHVTADDTCVWLLTLQESFRSAASFVKIDLGSDEIRFRASRARAEKKHSSATANVEFDRLSCLTRRRWCGEQLRPIETFVFGEVRPEVIEDEKVWSKIRCIQRHDLSGISLLLFWQDST